MGGFHSSKPGELHALFGELSGAMGAFYAATEELGIAGDVTAFTDSEFGRSLFPNNSGGTGRGWGNHHLVMGKSVLGGDIYGEFPDVAAAALDPAEGWVPTTSHERYLGTLSGWVGLPDSGWERNLGFMA